MKVPNGQTGQSAQGVVSLKHQVFGGVDARGSSTAYGGMDATAIGDAVGAGGSSGHCRDTSTNAGYGHFRVRADRSLV
ncbi:MAG TPA: hypothetical protein VIM19_17355 [Actinomycetes bacterium]